jgi:hypothetical protein
MTECESTDRPAARLGLSPIVLKNSTYSCFNQTLSTEGRAVARSTTAVEKAAIHPQVAGLVTMPHLGVLDAGPLVGRDALAKRRPPLGIVNGGDTDDKPSNGTARTAPVEPTHHHIPGRAR